MYIFIFVCMGVCPEHLCVYCVHSGAFGGQTRASDSLELSYRSLQASVCMLGTEPRSTVRIASALNHGAISAALTLGISKNFGCHWVATFDLKRVYFDHMRDFITVDAKIETHKLRPTIYSSSSTFYFSIQNTQPIFYFKLCAWSDGAICCSLSTWRQR